MAAFIRTHDAFLRRFRPTFGAGVCLFALSGLTVAYLGGAGGDVPAGNGAPYAPPPSPTVTASMTSAPLPTANNGAGKADPGDTIRHTAGISVSGTTAQTVHFSATPGASTTLVGGSVDISPKITVTGSVFDNDSEFLGDTFSLSKLQDSTKLNASSQ